MSFVNGIRRIAEASPEATALQWGGCSWSYAQLVAEVDVARRSEAPTASPVVVDRSARAVIEVLAAVDNGGAVLQSANGPASRTQPARTPIDPGTAMVLTTSGSTGVPKVVPITHAAVEAFAAWARVHFALETRRVLAFAPMTFDLAILEVWSTLLAGGTVVLATEREATDPDLLLELIRRCEVDLVEGVPFFYESIARSALVGRQKAPRVRDVVLTGGMASPATRRAATDVFDRARFHNVYGATETNDSFIATVSSERFRATEPLPIGRALSGVEAVLVAEDGRVVSGSGEGELHVRTPFMMSGYLDATGDAGVGLRRLGDGRRFFATGDVARRDADGTVQLVSRSSRLLKIRGNRISLDEVENAIGAHPAVRECAVILDADVADDESISLKAHVVRSHGEGVSTVELRQHCSMLLPAYAMPREIHWSEGALPRTSTGKLDRTALLGSRQPEGKEHHAQ